jgi:hypothetical protein
METQRENKGLPKGTRPKPKTKKAIREEEQLYQLCMANLGSFFGEDIARAYFSSLNAHTLNEICTTMLKVLLPYAIQAKKRSHSRWKYKGEISEKRRLEALK